MFMAFMLLATSFFNLVIDDVGPVLGDLRSDGVRIWYRAVPGTIVTVTVMDEEGAEVRSVEATCSAETDGCVSINLEGLEPGTHYEYSIDTFHESPHGSTKSGESGTDMHFETLEDPPGPSCRIAFGSCAKEAEGSETVWRRMTRDDITALVLLGDTPYIDSTDLAVQRRRYREFAVAPGFQQLVRSVPLYSTWDDHDIGANDTDGNIPGKENSRQAFTEYRPNPTFGEDGKGIYTHFRQGPVEVFLMDTRWFARTEDDPDHPTLLGQAQWSWLERGLRESTAPYKVLACGMIFNGATRPGKQDHWGSYPAEYERLLSLLQKHRIEGVILVAGDIHWSRQVNHDTKERLGYDIHEFITSPVHEHLIKAADAPHPGLVYSAGTINGFLVLEAKAVAYGEQKRDVLTATFRNASGEILHVQHFQDGDLAPVSR